VIFLLKKINLLGNSIDVNFLEVCNLFLGCCFFFAEVAS